METGKHSLTLRVNPDSTLTIQLIFEGTISQSGVVEVKKTIQRKLKNRIRFDEQACELPDLIISLPKDIIDLFLRLCLQAEAHAFVNSDISEKEDD